MKNEKDFGAKPIVVLLNWTPQPEKLVKLIWDVMVKDIQADAKQFGEDFWKKYLLGEVDPVNSEEQEILDVVKKEVLGNAFEFIQLNWFLGNVSRAFTHQIVRNRVGFSYSQQGMRVVTKEDFANRKMFHQPPNCKNPEAFYEAMKKIDSIYQENLHSGEHPEVARGLLPTNITTDIMVGANYRAWRQMVVKRSCVRVQGEFRQIVDLMIDEVERKMGPWWADIKPICETDGKCMVPSQWCGREKTEDGRQIIH